VTEDGLELTFALNHMAYFVLTALLLDNVKAAAPGARIISTASQMHRNGKVNFDDLQNKRGYTAWGAYSNSKLMNVLFTHTLAKRLEGSGVAAYCLHPGFVATRFGHESGGATQIAIRAAQMGAISVEDGAKTLIWLASEPKVAGASGGYFNRCAEEAPTKDARDDVVAERLWAESEKISGLA
jgi:NAD(P)-dependent dehydrogenase (short-subunit alcohol dehydrogenase family)